MRRPAIRRGLAAAAILALLAGPARSQELPGDEIPAELLAPDDDAQSLFEGLESGLITEEVLSSIADGEMAEMFDGVLAGRMTRGERVENWQDRGVDLEQEAAARTGGLAGNMTDAASHFGVQRTYFVGHPLETLLAPDLQPIGRYGPVVEGADIDIEIGHVSPRLVMVMRAENRRVGRAYCSHRTETILYSDPRIAATQADTIAFFSIRHIAERFDRLGICFGTEETEPGVYVTRTFDREGHRLPQMDEDQPLFRIVPFAPLPPATPRGERSDLAG